MAAEEFLKNIKGEVTCSICSDLFKDPVTTECEHSFCKQCITRLYKEKEFYIVCPQCRKKIQKSNLRANRELKNIVESMNQLLGLQREEEPGGRSKCKKHKEALKLFCKNDQTPICVICTQSMAHRHHIVVPMEEAVQDYKEKIAEQLEAIESSYDKLHQLVKEVWKYLLPSEQEKEHKRLKRVTDKVATLLKVDTESRRRRFEDRASQPQPHDSELKSSSPEREIAVETDLQGYKERENIRERAAEKQEETASHVIHICEEAPTPKYGLDHASLDPVIHTIGITTEDTEHMADITNFRKRAEDLMSPKQTPESELKRERGNNSAQVSEEQEEVANGVCEEAQTAKDRVSQASLDHVDVTSHRSRSQDSRFWFPNPSVESGEERKDGVSPGGNMATKTVLQSQEESEGQVSEGQKEAATCAYTEAETLVPKKKNVSSPSSQMHKQADVKSHSERVLNLTSVREALQFGWKRKDKNSPRGNAALQTELQLCKEDMTLDPATAHPRLVLSEDRKRMTFGETRQNLPNNPERFDSSASALGSEGFTSGKHYWEVEMGEEGRWAIGVTSDSVQRKGKILLQPEKGIWALISSEIPQFLPKEPRKIGVYLNYESGEVTFYDAENMALISSLTATFTGRVVPFFHLWAVGSHITLSPCQR